MVVLNKYFRPDWAESLAIDMVIGFGLLASGCLPSSLGGGRVPLCCC
jgi:hypothetical protein